MTTSENPEQNLEPKEDENPVVLHKNEEQDHDHKPDSQAGPSKPEKFINPPVQRRRSSLKVPRRQVKRLILFGYCTENTEHKVFLRKRKTNSSSVRPQRFMILFFRIQKCCRFN